MLPNTHISTDIGKSELYLVDLNANTTDTNLANRPTLPNRSQRAPSTPKCTSIGAETLSNSRVNATPFISDYKKAAIAAVACLFIVEIATSLARGLVLYPTVNPIIFAFIFYFIVLLILIISYIVCCVAIVRRLSGTGSRRYSEIRIMNLRFTLSAGGYIATIIMEVLSFILIHRPWATPITWYILYFTFNWTATLQVIALRPAKTAKTSTPSISNSNVGLETATNAADAL